MNKGAVFPPPFRHQFYDLFIEFLIIREHLFDFAVLVT